uniref:Uncharacterized protein n=1 Tax=Anguilla anguilla TaxID=7936 RepID=A0A0E9RGX9_ANGAN
MMQVCCCYSPGAIILTSAPSTIILGFI